MIQCENGKKYTPNSFYCKKQKAHNNLYINIHITSYRQTDVEHGTMFSVQTLSLQDLETIIHYLYNTESYRRDSGIFNMKYNVLLGTNTNIHIRTLQMMALPSFYYAESNTMYLQHTLDFTGKYIKLMFGKLIKGCIV